MSHINHYCQLDEELFSSNELFSKSTDELPDWYTVTLLVLTHSVY